jgi:hypothetical protein
MASRQLATAEAAHERRMADTAKAAEITERFTGWQVFSTRDGNQRLAARTGDQQPPDGDDDTWAATLIADSWTDLEEQLAGQAQHDAELTYEVQA